MKTQLIYLSFLTLNCQCNMGQSPTEKRFLNNVIVEDSIHENDKAKLLTSLKESLRKHESSFYSKEYYDSTELMIDTIFYNEKKNKIALFAITKNPTSRQLNPNKSYEFYYDAFCFLGKKNVVTDTWNIIWFNVFNLINYDNPNEVKERIKIRYFNELATVKDTTGNPFYKYNLNDKRFWESPAWEKYFN